MCQSFTNDGVMQERDKQLICLLITAKYNLIKKSNKPGMVLSKSAGASFLDESALIYP